MCCVLCVVCCEGCVLSAGGLRSSEVHSECLSCCLLVLLTEQSDELCLEHRLHYCVVLILDVEDHEVILVGTVRVRGEGVWWGGVRGEDEMSHDICDVSVHTLSCNVM